MYSIKKHIITLIVVAFFSNFVFAKTKSLSEPHKRVIANRKTVENLKRSKDFFENITSMVMFGGLVGSVTHFAMLQTAINEGNTALAMSLGQSVGGTGLSLSCLGMNIAFFGMGVVATYPLAKGVRWYYRKKNQISAPKFKKVYSAETRWQRFVHGLPIKTVIGKWQKRFDIAKTELYDEMTIMLRRNRIINSKDSRFTLEYGLLFGEPQSKHEKKRIEKHRKKLRQLESVAEIMAENLFMIHSKEEFIRMNFDNLPRMDQNITKKDRTRILHRVLVENLEVMRVGNHLIFSWKECSKILRAEAVLKKHLEDKLHHEITKFLRNYPRSSVSIKNEIFEKSDLEGWPYDSQMVSIRDHARNVIGKRKYTSLLRNIAKFAARDIIQETYEDLPYYWDNGVLKGKEQSSPQDIKVLSEELWCKARSSKTDEVIIEIHRRSHKSR